MSKPTVMVALKDTASVDTLVRLACKLAQGMQAELVALHIIEVSPGLPLDADGDVLDHPGKEILASARQVALDCCGTEISTQLVRARHAGEAVVGEAKDRGVELLVVGYHHVGRVEQILLGSTAQYVARHAPCRVIVQIPPLP